MFANIEITPSGGGVRKLWVNFAHVIGLEAQYLPSGQLHNIKLITAAGVVLSYGLGDGAQELLDNFAAYVAGRQPA